MQIGIEGGERVGMVWAAVEKGEGVGEAGERRLVAPQVRCVGFHAPDGGEPGFDA